MTIKFELTETEIDTIALRKLVSDNRAGAVVDFEGRVRNHTGSSNHSKSGAEPLQVLTLEYEAYASLAEAEAISILNEAQQRFAVYHAVACHRVGLLAIGEAAVYVAVSSAHRDEAFQACRFIIDSIKHRLPIWKKETYLDGSSGWVNCRHETPAGETPQGEAPAREALV